MSVFGELFWSAFFTHFPAFRLNMERYVRKKCPYSELFWPAFFPHFPAFGLNTKSKCGKISDQNNPEYGHFLSSVLLIIVSRTVTCTMASKKIKLYRNKLIHITVKIITKFESMSHTIHRYFFYLAKEHWRWAFQISNRSVNFHQL